MELSFTEKKSIRKSFGKLKEILSIPNLIDVQKRSYRQFLTSTDLNKSNLQLITLSSLFIVISPNLVWTCIVKSVSSCTVPTMTVPSLSLNVCSCACTRLLILIAKVKNNYNLIKDIKQFKSNSNEINFMVVKPVAAELCSEDCLALLLVYGNLCELFFY